MSRASVDAVEEGTERNLGRAQTKPYAIILREVISGGEVFIGFSAGECFIMRLPDRIYRVLPVFGEVFLADLWVFGCGYLLQFLREMPF